MAHTLGLQGTTEAFERLSRWWHSIRRLDWILCRCLTVPDIYFFRLHLEPLCSHLLCRITHHIFLDTSLTISQLQSLILTAISSVFQICALIWYLVSYFPMGSTGLQYMSRFGASRVTAWMSG